MPTPQSALMILAALGILTGIGTFRDMGDPGSNILVSVLATVTWALFGYASFDVILRDSANATTSGAIYSLAYLGLGLSITFGMLTAYAFVSAAASSSGATRETIVDD